MEIVLYHLHNFLLPAFLILFLIPNSGYFKFPIRLLASASDLMRENYFNYKFKTKNCDLEFLLTIIISTTLHLQTIDYIVISTNTEQVK